MKKRLTMKPNRDITEVRVRLPGTGIRGRGDGGAGGVVPDRPDAEGESMAEVTAGLSADDPDGRPSDERGDVLDSVPVEDRVELLGDIADVGSQKGVADRPERMIRRERLC